MSRGTLNVPSELRDRIKALSETTGYKMYRLVAMAVDLLEDSLDVNEAEAQKPTRV